MKHPRIAFVCLTVVVASLTLPLLSGCGTGPQRRYYSLAYQVQQDPAVLDRAPLYPLNIRLRRFTVAEPYNRPQIVYSESPFEFRYYGFRYWAAKPQKLLRDMIKEHLHSLNLVNSVELDYTDKSPDYEIGANIDAIEEFDSDGEWYAHLAMRLELTRFKDKTTIWRYSFDRKRKVEKKSPVYVVKAMSEILKAEIGIVAAQIDAALAAERGGKATLTCPAIPDDEIPVLESFPTEPDETLKEERPGL